MLLKITRNRILLYLMGATGFAFVQALVLTPMVSLAFPILLIDSLISTLLYLLIAIPLQGVIRFGKLELLILPLRLFIYLILAVFALALTLGAAYLYEKWLFPNEPMAIFISMLPFKALLAVISSACIILAPFKSDFGDDTEEELTEDIDRAPETDQQSDHSEIEILERFAVKSGSKIHVVLVSEIQYLVADGDYVQVVTDRGKYLKEQTMKYFETHLPEKQFARVHRSYIVRLEAISRIELYEKQNQQLQLKNGDKIKVSQAGYKSLREKLQL